MSFIFIEPVVDYECTFSNGDGQGGRQEFLGNTDSADKCAKLVRNKRPTANGVTWYSPNDEKKCYAEFGQTTKDNSQQYQNCMLQQNKGQLF